MGEPTKAAREQGRQQPAVLKVVGTGYAASSLPFTETGLSLHTGGCTSHATLTPLCGLPAPLQELALKEVVRQLQLAHTI